MKKYIFIVAIAAIILGLNSCNKEENSLETKLELSKSAKIKKGEPVSVKFSSVPESSTVVWEVSPNKDVSISPNGNQATLQFTNAGTYSVNATAGELKGTAILSVQDSIFNPESSSGQLIIDPLKDENITITISKIDSVGLNGLVLNLITEKKYKCLNNMLLLELSKKDQSFKINLSGVFRPIDSHCTAGEQKASAMTSLYPISQGTTTLEVVLDGKSYSGSLLVSGSKYTITWPYTKGVIITPLTIN